MLREGASPVSRDILCSPPVARPQRSKDVNDYIKRHVNAWYDDVVSHYNINGDPEIGEWVNVKLLQESIHDKSRGSNVFDGKVIERLDGDSYKIYIAQRIGLEVYREIHILKRSTFARRKLQFPDEASKMIARHIGEAGFPQTTAYRIEMLRDKQRRAAPRMPYEPLVEGADPEPSPGFTGEDAHAAPEAVGTAVAIFATPDHRRNDDPQTRDGS